MRRVTTFRELQRELSRAGWMVANGGKHLVATSPGGRRVTFSRTEHGGRALRNVLSYVRRAEKEEGRS